MPIFVMATKLPVGALKSPNALEVWERAAVGRIHSEHLDVNWVASYAILGPYDYIDVFEAGSNDIAMQVAALIRIFGHAHTEVWAAAQWDHFKDLMRELPVDRGEEACGWSRG